MGGRGNFAEKEGTAGKEGAGDLLDYQTTTSAHAV